MSARKHKRRHYQARGWLSWHWQFMGRGTTDLLADQETNAATWSAFKRQFRRRA